MKIRPANLSDCEGILAAHVASIREVASRDYSPEQVSGWSNHLTAKNYALAMTEGKQILFVAEDSGQIIGFSSIRGNEVMAVYVAPASIGKGTGHLLYDALEAHARDHGITELQLSSSVTALKFYQRHGFRILKATSFRLASGAELECFRMRKSLT